MMGTDEEILTRLRTAVRAGPPERPTWDPSALDTAPPLRLPGRRSARLTAGAALVVGLLAGSTGLAAAGALPDPAQHVAHEALDAVGLDVPDPQRYHGPECGDEVAANHGAYVSADHDLARTDCGKPLPAVSPGESAEAKADDGDPCTGPPPWAGRSRMTADEKAAAQAERAERCPDDADADGQAQGPGTGGAGDQAESSTPAPSDQASPGSAAVPSTAPTPPSTPSQAQPATPRETSASAPGRDGERPASPPSSTP